MSIPQPDGVSETMQAVLRRTPHLTADVNNHEVQGAHKDTASFPRNKSWTSSTYGSFVHQDHDEAAAVAHQRDLVTARHYVQWGAVPRGTTSVHGSSVPAPAPASGGPISPGHFNGPRAVSPKLEGTLLASGVSVPGHDGQPLAGAESHPFETRHTLRSPNERMHAVFPGHPGGSRGMVSGSQPLWSFERNPALLHGHLERDTGRYGRAVGGRDRVDASSVQGPSAFGILPRLPIYAAGGRDLNASLRAIGATPATAAFPSQQNPMFGLGLRETQSDDKFHKSVRDQGPILASPPVPVMRRHPGMHGMIGMQWDDAATPAGTSYKGSGGKFMGF